MLLNNQQTNVSLPTCDDRLLWDTWMSMFHFPTLTVADEVGLFPLLDKFPATAAEVAQSLSLSHRSTEALLGVMTSLGYLVQQSGKFHITEVSRNFLLPNSPYYWGGILHLMRSTPLSHSSLLEALQTDKSTIYDDQDIWETHELEPEQAKAFTRHMHSQTVSPAAGAAIRGDFTDVKRLLDVGGGSGAFSFALARRYPEICCTILELPVVCKIAEEYIASAGLQEQIDTKAADFFKDPFPEGYDAIVFGNIFHDWGREKCLLLARRSFEALPKGGRIYLHEILLSDTKDNPLVATSFSMCMVWVTEGKQFTAGELHQLLTECGFADILITPTYGYYSLISGTKP
ncbi:MAG: class I SAM-dependent methyltransferase [Mojavia pulchra JT2-VF2]|jgi:cyclopropane fatty-acyl-phospholipid synthase-like methyltransferase|uniref:Class I SAM-dependent methyltransferase n=1 Tax=Mojavia pulchra JT2-VF2 TaxID=287848 RepID=A0A951Q1T1_9NOST|nr:class I SAM-dependent methyltransferase [Mojavia pulchra JT2-VF2]